MTININMADKLSKQEVLGRKLISLLSLHMSGPIEWHHKTTPNFMKFYQAVQKMSIDPLCLKPAML
jgi:hypothetical protein